MSTGSFKPVIKWSGSKRPMADTIIQKFPETYDTYYEPFVGGGSILYAEQPENAVCGDVCEELVGIWRLIRDNPQDLLDFYTQKWKRLQDEGQDVYYEVRAEFNETRNPRHLFFLTRTCVNGLIRFNNDGDFNNSYHLSRPGIHPKRLGPIIFEWSRRIQTVRFEHGDYTETTQHVTENDFVYLDPPYFNTEGMYFGTIDQDRFLDFLKDLNDNKVRYALSFDGTSGDDDYTVDMPEWVYETRYAIPAGSSSFKRVLSQKVEQVTESLYVNYSPPENTQTSLSNYSKQ